MSGLAIRSEQALPIIPLRRLLSRRLGFGLMRVDEVSLLWMRSEILVLCRFRLCQLFAHTLQLGRVTSAALEGA